MLNNQTEFILSLLTTTNTYIHKKATWHMKDLRIIKNVPIEHASFMVLWLTSLSPSVSNSSNRIVLKCSSHTARLSSRAIFSSSINAPFLSSTRSLWLDSSFSRSATKSEWSKMIQVRAEDNLHKQAIFYLNCTGTLWIFWLICFESMIFNIIESYETCQEHVWVCVWH